MVGAAGVGNLLDAIGRVAWVRFVVRATAALCLGLAMWQSAGAAIVIQIEDVDAEPGQTVNIEIYAYVTSTTSFSSFNLIVTAPDQIPLSSSPPQQTSGDYVPIFGNGVYGAIPPVPFTNTLGQYYAYASGMDTSGTVQAGETGGVMQFSVAVPSDIPLGDYQFSLTGVEVTDEYGIPIETGISFVGGTLHVVPEPSTIVLLVCAGLGGVGLAVFSRVRRRRQAALAEPEPEPFFED